MPTKRDPKTETRKNAATTSSTASNPSVRPCITVQNPPGATRDSKSPPTCTDDGKKNFHPDTTTAPPTNPPATNTPTEAEQLMFQALKQLQEMYDDACKTKANKIMIERATFEKIATTFQQAYEQIKTKTSTSAPAPENMSILNVLQQIEARITNLEATQTTRNVPRTDAPAKTYTKVVKTPITAAQLHKHQEQQRTKAQRIQSTITLNTTETNDKTQQWFQAENNENIATTIQNAVESQLNIPCAILGISKQQNIIKIHHHMSDKDAEEVEQHMNWNTIAEGLKPHDDIHGVVVHGVPKTIDITDPQIIESLKEVNHCIKPDAIARIIPLRRNPTEAEHHSIIVFSKYPEELNTWIERGFGIKYQIYRTERYSKRMQLTQCFNCYGYGHHAKTCQAKTCCGKCGESHETQNCKNTTVKCCQCKGPHEAWHYKCPIRLMKRKTLKELKHQLPYKFIVPYRTPHQTESGEEEEEEEEEEPPSSLGDTKTPFSSFSSFGNAAPNFPSFGNTTPTASFSAFGNSVPSFGTFVSSFGTPSH
jgi:hypothetical protein